MQAKILDPSKKFWPSQRPMQKILTQAKIYLTHPKDVKIMTHVKNILTFATHATNVKIWPTQPIHSRTQANPTPT